jgi:hypothetical protein
MTVVVVALFFGDWRSGSLRWGKDPELICVKGGGEERNWMYVFGTCL